jgi:hypothetical protein
MEKYQLQIIIVLIVMLCPIILISSTLHHIKVCKEKVIKQKFQIIGLIFEFLIEILKLGLSVVFFFIFFKLLNFVVFKQNLEFWAILFLGLLGVFALTIGYLLLKTSVFFFRHLYFESIRNVYFEKETGKLIVNSNNFENYIDLNSLDVTIVKYETSFNNKLINLGKTEIYNNGEIIIISSLLDLTPELNEKILNGNVKIILKNFNWI